jgi:shikimate kinase
MKFAAALLLPSVLTTIQAFAPSTRTFFPKTLHYAGGFEWEDPVAAFDQHVDNPFKNSELLNTGDGMKIDPARLLSPRLAGSNLYFVGMMGCGKSSVGDLVARRTFLP